VSTIIVPSKKILQPSFREADFRLDPDHSLSDGLQLFFGGRFAGGSTAFNSSPYPGLDGTLTNMTPSEDWVTDRNRYALDFDISNHYVITQGSVQGPGTGDFTFSAWVNCESSPGNYPVLFGTGNYDSPGSWHYRNHNTVTTFVIVNRAVTASESLDGVLGHVLLVRSSDAYKLYVNGEDKTAIDSAAGYGISLSTLPFYVGGIPDGGFRPNVQYDNCIWNRALTPSEIQLLASDDPYYDGWIQPSLGRRYFPVSSGAAPASGNPWYYYAQL
jgi:hypothetical protein